VSAPTKEQEDAAIIRLQGDLDRSPNDPVQMPCFWADIRIVLDALADARRRLEEMQADKERLDCSQRYVHYQKISGHKSKSTAFSEAYNAFISKNAGCSTDTEDLAFSDGFSAGVKWLEDLNKELRKYRERMEWLHDCSTGCKDLDGFEWGIYRVKWNEHGQAEQVWQTNSDFSDLDAEMAREEDPCEGCGKLATTSDSDGIRLCEDCARACDEDDDTARKGAGE